MQSLYSFNDYRKLLKAILDTYGPRSGKRKMLAESIGSPASHISQVLAEKTHLTLEQAEIIAQKLELKDDKSLYFIFLVHHGRAGTPSLRDFYQTHIESIKQRNQTVSGRIESTKHLNSDVKNKYFSSWIYLAINLSVMIKNIQTPDDISKHLNLPLGVVEDAVNFLLENELIKQSNKSLHCENLEIFIKDSDPKIMNHHLNWRFKAQENIQLKPKNSIHYSAAFTASEATAQTIKSRILELIESNLKDIKEAPSEQVYVYNTDFFKISNT